MLMKKICTRVWGGEKRWKLTLMILIMLLIPGRGWAYEHEGSVFKYEVTSSYDYIIKGFSQYASADDKVNLEIQGEYGEWGYYNKTYFEEVAESAFENNTTIESLAFSDDYYLYQKGFTFRKASFKGCTNLKSADLTGGSNSNVETIEEESFANTGLEILFLPSSIKAIGGKAFYNTSLKTVNLLSSYPTTVTLGTDIFNTSVEGFKIYVPIGTRDKYVADGSPWKAYAEYIQENPELTLQDGQSFADIPAANYQAGCLKVKRTFTAGQYATVCLPFSIKLSDYTDQIEAVYTPMSYIIHNVKDVANDYYIMMLNKKDMNEKYYNTISSGNVMFIKLKADADPTITFKNCYDMNITSSLYDASKQKYDDRSLTHDLTVIDWDGVSGMMTTNSNLSVEYGGNMEAKAGSSTLYTFNKDGSFGLQKSESLNPFRMYLTITNAKKQALAAPVALSIGVGGNGNNTTAIEQIMNDMQQQGKAAQGIYSLDGKKVSEAGDAHGLPKGVYIKNGKKFIVK